MGIDIYHCYASLRHRARGALVIQISCGGVLVGGVVVVPVTGLGSNGSMEGVFHSLVTEPGQPSNSPTSLNAAAAACGEDHFNWYQVVTSDNNPPRGGDGNPLIPPVR